MVVVVGGGGEPGALTILNICSLLLCVLRVCRGDGERDVFNEKPSKEEQLSVAESSGRSAVTDLTILHTTMGDIHIKLFPERWVEWGRSHSACDVKC